MSDTNAATPQAPASDALDAIMVKLMAEEAAGTDAAPEAQQPNSEALTEDPDAGAEQSQEAEPEPQPEEPPRYRVKVRGREVEVPLPELLNGYSRTEDYKAKTAEVAREREALAAKEAEITARVQRLDVMLQQAPLDPVLAEGQRTDWVRLAQEDPAGYVQKKAAFDARLTQWNAVAQERMQAQQAAFAQQVQRANDALSERLPEWRDEAKRPEVVATVRSTLSHYGFNDQELAGLADHRMLLVALDAARYRAGQQARQTVANKQVAPQPVRTMRPGGGEKAKPNTRAILETARNSRHIDTQVDAVMRVLSEG